MPSFKGVKRLMPTMSDAAVTFRRKKCKTRRSSGCFSPDQTTTPLATLPSHPASTPAAMAKPTQTRKEPPDGPYAPYASKARAQSFINVGQADFDNKTCRLCGFLYAPGQPKDERMHRLHHAAVVQGVKAQGLPNSRRVEWQPRPGCPLGRQHRLVEIIHNPRQIHNKVAEVGNLVSKQLGLPDAWLLAVPSKVYLCIKGNRPEAEQIVGVAIAQRIQWARRARLARTASPIAAHQTQQGSMISKSNPLSTPSKGACKAQVVTDSHRMKSPGQLPMQPLSANPAAVLPDGCGRFVPCQNACCQKESSAAIRPYGQPRAAAAASPATPARQHSFTCHPSGRSPAQLLSPSGSAPRSQVNSLRRWLLPNQAIPASASGSSTQTAVNPTACSANAAVVVHGPLGHTAADRSETPSPMCERGHSSHTVASGSTVSVGQKSMTVSGAAIVSGGSQRVPPSSSPEESASELQTQPLEMMSSSAVTNDDRGQLYVAPSTPCHQYTPQQQQQQQQHLAVVDKGRPERAVCGLRVIWVSKDSRRCGIAGRLVDAVRSGLVTGYVVPAGNVAFSQLTADGLALVANYTGVSEEVLVYS